MPRKEVTRTYHHGDLKATLITAALELIAQQGTRGFSLAAAARLAGVSVAAPYRHFRDKDALLAAIVVEGNTLLYNSLRLAADRCHDDTGKLLAIALTYVAFARQHARYFEVIFHAGIDKSQFPEVGASARQAFEVARTAAAHHTASPKAAMQLALAVWTMAHGIATLEAEGALHLIAGTPNTTPMIRRLLAALLANFQAQAATP